MTRVGLQRALVDLGWLALIQRALGGKPSSTYALYQLMRHAGRPVAWDEIKASYDSPGATASMPGVQRGGRRLSGTHGAIRKRIERVRGALADIGCEDAIQTLAGDGSYGIERHDLPRIEAALLFACGFELDEARAA